MTEIEDHQRRYYHKGETLEFENVENEWPIFYINMIIDGVEQEVPLAKVEEEGFTKHLDVSGMVSLHNEFSSSFFTTSIVFIVV